LDLATINAVISQYAGHGWRLRRALLSRDSIGKLWSSFESEHGDVSLTVSDDEALWFSRRSLPDREAWELRRLSGSPFALVAVLEDSLDDDEREAVLKATERRMFDGSHPEPTSH
jgi:hypothetical protein